MSAFFTFTIISNQSFLPFDVWFQSTFFDILRFFHSTFFTFQHFVVNVFFISCMLCPSRRFFHSMFCPVRSFSFEVSSVEVFNCQHFLLRRFVGESKISSWDLKFSLTCHFFPVTIPRMNKCISQSFLLAHILFSELSLKKRL
jgi:hypothetical protein